MPASQYELLNQERKMQETKKTGNLLSNNQINIAVFCTLNHTVKFFSLFRVRSRDALIGKYGIKLPIGITLDILTEIMSSIAQEESRKTSERVKWGQKRQMERDRKSGV